MYEVELTATVSPENQHPAGLQGQPERHDRLSGVLIGYEPNTPDDDVVYMGTLLRDTKVDYCLTKGRKRPETMSGCIAPRRSSDSTPPTSSSPCTAIPSTCLDESETYHREWRTER